MLTKEELRKKAPAIFSDNPAPHVSDRYCFIPTYKILEEFSNRGWIPIFAKQQKTRNPNDKDFTKHTVMLRKLGVQANLPVLGSLLPTIRATNSHNWASEMLMEYGQLRIACGNGLTYVGAMFSNYSIRHDHVFEDMNDVLDRFEDQSLKMEEIANRWASIPISNDQERELAYNTAKLRYTDNPTEDHINSLTICRRPEDAGNDLFRTFNRIQENALKGGNKIGKRKSRPLTNIGKESEVNKGIFLLAASYDKEHQPS